MVLIFHSTTQKRLVKQRGEEERRKETKGQKGKQILHTAQNRRRKTHRNLFLQENPILARAASHNS